MWSAATRRRIAEKSGDKSPHSTSFAVMLIPCIGFGESASLS